MAIIEEQKRKTTMLQRYTQSMIGGGEENDSLCIRGGCAWLFVSLKKHESAPIGYYSEPRFKLN